MSVAAGVRADLQMPPERVRETLERGYCGRRQSPRTVSRTACYWSKSGRRGRSFCPRYVPAVIWQRNLDLKQRVGFGVDEPGGIPNGRWEWDTTLANRSGTRFGSIVGVEDAEATRTFFTRLMAKYARQD